MFLLNKRNGIFWLVLIALLLQNCKSYHKSISLNEAALKKSENLYKVTLITGEELIVENIEIDNEMYFGTSIKEDKKERILIEKSKVKLVQEMNPKASKSINGVGIGLGIGSIVLVVLMFGT
jgi:hypothetical protein